MLILFEGIFQAYDTVYISGIWDQNVVNYGGPDSVPVSNRGFGMLEMGSAARGHEVNIMLKNVYDVVFGALAYYMTPGIPDIAGP